MSRKGAATPICVAPKAKPLHYSVLTGNSPAASGPHLCLQPYLAPAAPVLRPHWPPASNSGPSPRGLYLHHCLYLHTNLSLLKLIVTSQSSLPSPPKTYDLSAVGSPRGGAVEKGLLLQFSAPRSPSAPTEIATTPPQPKVTLPPGWASEPGVTEQLPSEICLQLSS